MFKPVNLDKALQFLSKAEYIILQHAKNVSPAERFRLEGLASNVQENYDILNAYMGSKLPGLKIEKDENNS